LLETDFFGSEFQSLERASVFDFEVELVVGTRRDLLEVAPNGLPLIASVHSLLIPNHAPPGGAHGVVVVGATRNQVAILDPDKSGKPVLVKSDVFMKAWEQRRFRTARLRPLVRD
jgi:hypothetical protein